MSVQTKLNAAKNLSNIIQKWPKDSHKVYNSFRDAQLKLYDTNTPSELPSAETLDARAAAASKLLQNVNSTKFTPNPRILKPDGNPMYYDLIRREANGEQKKFGLLTSINNTLFGWWKK